LLLNLLYKMTIKLPFEKLLLVTAHATPTPDNSNTQKSALQLFYIAKNCSGLTLEKLMPFKARTTPTPDDRISQKVALQLYCTANLE